MLSAKIIFKLKKVGHKNDELWNHKDYESIHVDKNHTDSNQSIPDDSKKIG